MMKTKTTCSLAFLAVTGSVINNMTIAVPVARN